MSTFIKVTVEEVEKNFDFCLDLVERGYTFLIQSEKGNVIMAPVGKPAGIDQVDLELLESQKAAQYAPMQPPPPIPGVTLPSDNEVKGYVDETLGELTRDF